MTKKRDEQSDEADSFNPFNPFDSESENRYQAFEAMRAQAPVHEVAGGRRFAVSQKAVAEGLKSVTSRTTAPDRTGSRQRLRWAISGSSGTSLRDRS